MDDAELSGLPDPSGLDERLDGFEGALSELGERTGAMGDQLRGISEGIATLHEKFDRFEQRMAILSRQQSWLQPGRIALTAGALGLLLLAGALLILQRASNRRSRQSFRILDRRLEEIERMATESLRQPSPGVARHLVEQRQPRGGGSSFADASSSRRRPTPAEAADLTRPWQPEASPSRRAPPVRPPAGREEIETLITAYNSALRNRSVDRLLAERAGEWAVFEHTSGGALLRLSDAPPAPRQLDGFAFFASDNHMGFVFPGPNFYELSAAFTESRGMHSAFRSVFKAKEGQQYAVHRPALVRREDRILRVIEPGVIEL